MNSINRWCRFAMILTKQRNSKFLQTVQGRTKVTEASAVQSLSNKDKLFTPGPMNVSERVKKAMLVDLGTRHHQFIDVIKFIRRRLLSIANVDLSYTSIPLQGSGTNAVEATIVTSLRNKKKVVIVENGTYGRRLCEICRISGIDFETMSFKETEQVDVDALERFFESRDVDGFVMVHCETSSGVVNPVSSIGKLVKSKYPDCTFIVDAMSSFGAIPLDLTNVDFMISSANKCIQGTPGFAYVIANKKKLLSCKGESHSLASDLVRQYEYLEVTGQFRFTPPTHVMLAFKEALDELEEEGGVKGRAERYKSNCDVLNKGMEKMGFRPLLDQSKHELSYIITSYHCPKHQNFNFDDFYGRLSETGHIIYPGSVTKADCFRIGNIGDVFPDDMRSLLDSIRHVCSEMGIELPLKENK